MANNFNMHIPRGIPLQPTKKQVTPNSKRSSKSNFQEIFQQELEKPIEFSAHATKRLSAKNIKLSEVQLKTLEESVDKIAQKGGKESLVVVDDLAFVVSVNNKTVITVIDSERLKENVFTNIDSAVIN